MKTISMRIKAGGVNGAQYSEAEREEYKARWEAFGAFFKRVRQKGTRAVRARVLRITGPMRKPDPFNPGETKRVFELLTEFRQPEFAGITHTFDVTVSLDDRSKLFALYAAATGENPETDSEYFDFQPGIVTTRDVLAVIKRQKDRTDGKRGGFFFDVAGFEPIIEELDNPADDIAPDAWVEPEGQDEDAPAAPRAVATARPAPDDLFDDSDEEAA